jgi:fatty-acyl-CoA synthase
LIANSSVSGAKNTVFLCCVPLTTSGSTTFLPAMMAGATYVIAGQQLSPETISRYIVDHSVSQIYLSCSQLCLLLDWCKSNNLKFKTLNRIITGTERISGAKLKEAVQLFGPIITVGYGMVEALPPATMLSENDYTQKNDVWDSVGKPVSGVQIKLMEDGHIAIKSNTVAYGYLVDMADIHADPFKDGWFHSSDFGYFDKNGYLYVLGREEEIIKRSKQLTVFARYIEDKVYELGFIKMCCLERKDNKIILFASIAGGKDPDRAKQEIINYCSMNLRDLVVPDEVVITELPLNAMGKLDRRKLVEVNR